MKCRLALSVLLTLPLLHCSDARAEFTDWSYTWSRTPLAVLADEPGSGGISLALGSSPDSAGASEITALVLTTFSSAPDTEPDSITDGTYSVTLDITDNPSSTSGSLTFGGLFEGTLWTDDADIKHTFSVPETQDLVLGGRTYTVTIGPYEAPGAPSSGLTGAIKARVSVTEPTDPPPTAETPEPGSLLLASLACGCAGVVSWRRKRKAKEQVV